MSDQWMPSARVLVDRVEHGLEGLWSLVFAAQNGALRLAQDRELDGDLSLTLAAMELGEALEELEWTDPELPAVATSLVLGPAPPDELADCRAAVGVLLVGALEAAARLLRDQHEDLGTPEVLCLARVVHLLSGAQLRIAGELQ